MRHLTTLANPKPREDLILYVSASHTTVSAVLIQEREKQANNASKGKKKVEYEQKPVYFVSKALAGSKIFYS